MKINKNAVLLITSLSAAFLSASAFASVQDFGGTHMAFGFFAKGVFPAPITYAVKSSPTLSNPDNQAQVFPYGDPLPSVTGRAFFPGQGLESGEYVSTYVPTSGAPTYTGSVKIQVTASAPYLKGEASTSFPMTINLVNGVVQQQPVTKYCLVYNGYSVGKCEVSVLPAKGGDVGMSQVVCSVSFLQSNCK